MNTQELLDVLTIFYHGQNQIFSSSSRFINSPPEVEEALTKLMFEATKLIKIYYMLIKLILK